MPKVTQLSAWVENRPGMLGQVADALGKKKVNIRAFMATVMSERGFVRVVVDKPAVARKVFSAHGWRTTEDEILEVGISDRPGALGRIADRLGAAGVNIDYAYLGNARSASRINLYIAVADTKAGLRALRR
jgi:hypothetical protein